MTEGEGWRRTTTEAKGKGQPPPKGEGDGAARPPPSVVLSSSLDTQPKERGRHSRCERWSRANPNQWKGGDTQNPSVNHFKQ